MIDIYVNPKHTSANTQYYKFKDTAQREWFYKKLAEYCYKMGEYAHDNAQFREAYYTPNKRMTKRNVNGRWVYNSVASMIAGLLHNNHHNPNIDLSDKHLKPCEELFEVFSAFDGFCQEIKFRTEAEVIEAHGTNRFDSLFDLD